MIGQLVLLLLFTMDSYALGDYTRRRIDLALIVDASWEIKATNFQKQLEFLQFLVSMADIDEGKVRVGAVVFSEKAQVVFHLNSSLTSSGVKDAIGRIPYLKGGTQTGPALDLTRSEIFTTDNGDRFNADNIAVLITDGDPWTAPPNDEATALKNKNVRVIVVTIGAEATEYESIGSSPSADHIFYINTFDDLVSDQLKIATSIFQAATKLERSCRRYQRKVIVNNCLEFSFELSAQGRDFQKVSSVALQEPLGKDRSVCAELCTRHAECLSFVIRDDGRCQLFDLICNVTSLATAPSASVYVIQHGNTTEI